MNDLYEVTAEIYDANNDLVDTAEVTVLLEWQEVKPFRTSGEVTPILLAEVKDAMRKDYELKEGDELEIVKVRSA